MIAPALPGAPLHSSPAGGLDIYSVPGLSFHPEELSRRIRLHQPDWILVSSEDLTHVLLREAARTAPGRIVYLAHTPQFFPFGPESWHPDPAAAELVRAAAAIVVIGRHMAGYVRRHLGREPAVIHPPIYGDPPFADLAGFGRRRVLMINPCAVKGLPIFLELARLFPGVTFAALRGWGTTPEDEAALSALPNTELLENVSNIEDALRLPALLLMPSLWYEGFGLIAMEALLRGLPVISSDSGGLLEAKAGTGYVIPVRPITRYLPEFDAALMPRPVLPEQDAAGWAAALDRLLHNEAEYRAESERSRRAGLDFVARLDPGAFERFLLSLTPAPPPQAAGPAAGAHTLDEARRALLLRRLKNKARRP